MKRSVFAVAPRGSGPVRHSRRLRNHHRASGKGRSPHVRTEWTIDGATSRSSTAVLSLKGRTPGKDFTRMKAANGAPAPMKRPRSRPTSLEVRTLSVPGRHLHALYTIRTGGTWSCHQQEDRPWGIPYPKGEDLGRVRDESVAPRRGRRTTHDQRGRTPPAARSTSTGAPPRASIPFTVG